MEQEVRGVEVGESEPLEQDRSAAVGRQVNVRAARDCRRIDIGEASDVGERPQVDPVLPVGEVGDGIGAVPGTEHEDVAPRPSREAVVALAALERVAALAAHEAIVPLAALERVAALAALKRVVAPAALKPVGGGVAGDPVVARAGNDVLDHRLRSDEDLAVPAEDRRHALGT